ncbi:MAG: hypothetical protein ACOCY6_01570 [Halodesulfurarchaeum sp.]
MAKTNWFNPKSTGGSLVFVLVLVVVVTILHYDFWNWGPDQFTFMAWTQEFFYRFVLVTFLFPFFNYIIGRFSWPMPDEEVK